MPLPSGACSHLCGLVAKKSHHVSAELLAIVALDERQDQRNQHISRASAGVGHQLIVVDARGDPAAGIFNRLNFLRRIQQDDKPSLNFALSFCSQQCK